MTLSEGNTPSASRVPSPASYEGDIDEASPAKACQSPASASTSPTMSPRSATTSPRERRALPWDDYASHDTSSTRVTRSTARRVERANADLGNSKQGKEKQTTKPLQHFANANTAVTPATGTPTKFTAVTDSPASSSSARSRGREDVVTEAPTKDETSLEAIARFAMDKDVAGLELRSSPDEPRLEPHQRNASPSPSSTRTHGHQRAPSRQSNTPACHNVNSLASQHPHVRQHSPHEDQRPPTINVHTNPSRYFSATAWTSGLATTSMPIAAWGSLSVGPAAGATRRRLLRVLRVRNWCVGM
ncbi:hypothetical protein H2203_006455 [Taxawa tesnikishii (nom. ined.)]|nr:hypothetical protein H2203_006455 [Dothideales sp. JES 119]